MWQQHPKTEAQSKHNKTKWSFCGQRRRVDKAEAEGEEEQESGQPERGVTGLRERKRGEGQLVMLAAGQAAYKIHKISALKSAVGQKLKT